MSELIFAAYLLTLVAISLCGIGTAVLMFHYVRIRRKGSPLAEKLMQFPSVTVQLPLYNERYVVRRLLDAVTRLDYPRTQLEIQVLDDSTDDTSAIIAGEVSRHRAAGIDIQHLRRGTRRDFKAGALREGLRVARGEFIAIFDADFIPQPDFLLRTLPHLVADHQVGMVQTRWEHLNAARSILTQVQALNLDKHFVIEQQVRSRTGLFMSFNGTAGIWRRECILDAGNWEADTLTEDLDLSIRAQLRRWKFVYLNGVATPSELPLDIHALKIQQYRWTKGAVETARKLLPRVWTSDASFSKKTHATFHLLGNLIFPVILAVTILHPLAGVMKPNLGYGVPQALGAALVVVLAATFLSIIFSQRDLYGARLRQLFMVPMFLAGTMGLAVNNTRAVLGAVRKRNSEFIRTPKYGPTGRTRTGPHPSYLPSNHKGTMVIEVLLALYSVVGFAALLLVRDYGAMPFQLLLAAGYGGIAWLSLGGRFGSRRGQLFHDSNVFTRRQTK